MMTKALYDDTNHYCNSVFFFTSGFTHRYDGSPKNMMGDKRNVLSASFRINSLANKHTVRKHVIYKGKFFSTYLPLCLKTLSLI